MLCILDLHDVNTFAPLPLCSGQSRQEAGCRLGSPWLQGEAPRAPLLDIMVDYFLVTVQWPTWTRSWMWAWQPAASRKSTKSTWKHSWHSQGKTGRVAAAKERERMMMMRRKSVGRGRGRKRESNKGGLR
eukprot:1161993-Pelagomonas_calceolata.AAC.3